MSALTDRVDALHIRTTSDLAKLTDALRSEAALTGCPISKALMERAAIEIDRLRPDEHDARDCANPRCADPEHHDVFGAYLARGWTIDAEGRWIEP